MSEVPVAVAAVAVLIAVVVGVLVGAVMGRARSSERIARLREELAGARAAAGADGAMVDAFHSAAARAVAEQSQRMVQLAEERYRALEQGSREQWRSSGDAVVARLSEYAQRLGALEDQRQRESAVLAHAVGELRRSHDEVRHETRTLAAALTDNRVRGSWGEMQLRRVLEHSGMVAHADFVEQRSVPGSGGVGRPDVVVRLPNDRCVVIDAKAPLDSYLAAMDSDDDAERTRLLGRHADAVASHVAALSKRRYADAVEGSVDFVVMFVPGDAFLSAAFDARPGLMDSAAAQDVILASPGTLLAFLRGVACGWSERRVAEEAEAVAALGRELHERVAIFAEHFASVGSSLGRAVGSYNDALGSLERRLMVTARRFEEHGAGSRRALRGDLEAVEMPSRSDVA